MNNVMKMKHAYISWLTLVLTCVFSTFSSMAQDIVVNRIGYNFLPGNKLEVTYIADDPSLGWLYSDDAEAYVYTGDINIPSTINYEGTTYTVTAVGDFAFYESPDLGHVTLPSTVTSLGYCAFQHAFTTGIDLPGVITYLDEYAFFESQGAFSLAISGVDVITEGCFQGSSVESVVISPSLKTVENYAFYECKNLKSVVFEEGSLATSIGKEAFFGCNNLTELVLGQNIQTIGLSAFNSCAISTLELPSSLVTIGERAFYGNEFEELVIPNSVTGIGIGAFWNCSYLKSVQLSENITTIKDATFQACSSLEKLVIPASVTTVEKDAFRGTTSLKYLQLKSSTPPSIVSNSFDNKVMNDKSLALFVPDGARDAYAAHPVWGVFVETIADKPVVTVNASTNIAACGTVMGDGFYLGGQTVTLTATPDSKYLVSGWDYPTELGFTPTIDENTFQFTISDELASQLMESNTSINIVANFEKKKYSLSLSYNDAEGIVTGATDGQLFEVDSKVTLTAVPNSGYHFLKFTDENDDELSATVLSSVATTDVVFADKNMTVNALFEENPQFNVSLSIDGESYGSVSGLRPGGIYLEGQRIDLTAVPAEHSQFKGWTVDGVPGTTDNELIIEDVDKDYTISAKFVEDPKSTITIGVKDNVPGCSVAFLNESYSSPQTLYVGQTAAVNVTATAPHYHFVEWIDASTEVQVNSNQSFVITYGESDAHYLAVFEEDPKYGIEVKSNIPAASDLVETTYDNLYSADSKLLGFTVNPGYEFLRWEYGEKGSSTTSTSVDPSQTVVVLDKNLVYTAIFQLKSYGIYTSASNGTVSTSPTNAVMGTEITVTPTPAVGYELENVTTDVPGLAVVDGKFTMPASDVVVTATFKAIEYNVSSGATANGSISLSAAKAVMGTEVTITPTPAEGYELDALSTTPALLITDNKFTMPAGDVVVNATFKAIEYSINKGTTTNGSIALSADKAVMGTEITVTPTPAEGYDLENITTDVPGLAVVDGKFVMPAKNVTVTATFKAIEYNVTSAATTNGSVSLSAAKATIGTEITIDATPAEGYELDALSTTPALLITDNKFTMPASDVVVNATFKAIEYSINKGTTTNGSIALSADKAVMGTEITVTPTPAEGYELENITTDVPGLAVVDGKFVMPAKNVTVTATFKAIEYNVTSAAITNGSVSLSAAKATIGTEITIDATPAEGYELDALSTTPALLITDNKFTMPASDVVVNATFKAIEYSINKGTTANGSIALSAEKAVMGTEITVTPTSAEGYELDNITTDVPGLAVVDGKFVMPAKNVTVTATFKPIEYNVSSGTTVNGSISLSAAKATIGTEITIDVTPAEGYELDALSTTPALLITDNKFTMPASDVVVNATFKLVNYTISAPTPANGSVFLSATNATMGEEIQVTVIPDAGYELESLSTDVEGLVIADDKFVMPSSNVTVNVSFKLIDEFSITAAPTTNGTITLSAEKATIGTEVSVVATPSEGYSLESLTTDVEGLSIVDGKFVMPAKDVTVSAVFQAIEYNVLKSDVANGTITLSAEKATIGTEVSVVATPAEGYSLESLTTNVEGLSIVDGKFVMPAKDVTVSAVFQVIEYNVLKSDVANGTITLSAEKATIGTEVSVVATPSEGYSLESLTTNVEGLTIVDGKFVMPAKDVTVSAVFQAIEYNVLKSDVTNGAITLSAEKATIGTEVSVVATPAEGYSLESLTTNVEGLAIVDGKFVMPAKDVTVSAVFQAIEYNVLKSDVANGTITLSAEKATIGTEVSVVATPAEGYSLESLTTNVEGLAIVDGKFVMPAKDVTVSAVFQAIEYNVSAAESLNGAISVDKSTAIIGDEIVISVVPSEGYELDAISTNVEGVVVADNKFVMPAKNITLSATFKAIVYNVSTAEVEHGSIESSVDTAIIGTEIKIVATPDLGYEFAQWQSDEVEIIDSMFVMPAKDVTISAKFNAIEYDVIVGGVVNGTVKVSQEKAIIGDVITLDITPYEGYELESLSSNDVEIVDDKFVMPASDVNISATFKVACATCKEKIPVVSIFDWILAIDNKTLSANGIEVKAENVTWYRVVGAADEWCEGVQEILEGEDEKISTGLYFADDEKSLINTGDYYAVVSVDGHICKYMTSEVINYSPANKKLTLTPNSVRHGQILTLRGLPSVNAIVNVYDVKGSLIRTMKTDSSQSISFEAETVDGVYIVSVVANDIVKSVKYIVK